VVKDLAVVGLIVLLVVILPSNNDLQAGRVSFKRRLIYKVHNFERNVFVQRAVLCENFCLDLIRSQLVHVPFIVFLNVHFCHELLRENAEIVNFIKLFPDGLALILPELIFFLLHSEVVFVVSTLAFVVLFLLFVLDLLVSLALGRVPVFLPVLLLVGFVCNESELNQLLLDYFARAQCFESVLDRLTVPSEARDNGAAMLVLFEHQELLDLLGVGHDAPHIITRYLLVFTELVRLHLLALQLLLALINIVLALDIKI